MSEIKNPKSKILNWRVWFDENTSTVRHWSKGKNDEQLAKNSSTLMREELSKHPDAVGVLVDVSETSTVNGKARQAFAEFVKSIDKRVAFYGANKVMRVVIKLVFGATGKMDNMKIFGTEEEALEWLKQS
jgi:hypothetical protein